jgi:amino acid adenylation domain-containing protein
MNPTPDAPLSIDEEARLLALLLGEEDVAAGGGDETIGRTEAMTGAPSYAQEAMWFLGQLAPESTFYNVPMALRLRGRLDPPTLERALQVCVDRHEALRTRFVSRGPVVEQVVGTLDVRVPLVDLTASPAESRDAEVKAISARELATRFDLAAGPLFRAQLLRLEDDEHVLVLTMHHIICDAWSSAVLLRDLGAAYDALAEGRPVDLEPLPVRYLDYAQWQRRRMSGERLDQLLAYWRKQLGGAEPTLALPFDRPRPSVQRHAGGRETIHFPAALAEKLRVLAREEGVTLFMLLLTVFDVLLSRYSGQHDVVVATPAAGRDRADFERLVGLFVNTLVMRTSLEGDPSFGELVARVRDLCLDAFAHGDLPFEKLVQELHPQRDLSRNPLFQVMFVLQNAPQAIDVSRHFTVAPLIVDNTTEKFDLTLEVEDLGSELRVRLSYDRDLFEAATARRMLGHFRRLAEAVTEDPSARVSRLPLMTDGEREQLLRVWNDTAAPVPQDALHQLVAAQARRTPEAPAVISGARTMTYAELDAAAGRLAGALRARGVGAEAIVGVHVARSPEMVVAVLGVLKAGAAFLPLDPSYPKERLRYMIDDARVPVVLSQRAHAAELPASEAEVLALDDSWWEGAAPFAAAADPESLAYVIYTSGSTGRPKGVAVPHRGIVNYLTWASAEYRVAEGKGAIVHSSLAFDLTLTSLFSPLVVGGAAYLVDERGIDALGEAAAAVRDLAVIKITPAHLEVLAHSVPAEDAGELANCFVIGGEALFAEHLAHWRRHASATRLINEYGPTETVVGCCIYDATATSSDVVIPIGRPIANTRLYVLDGDGEPVPAGVVGELYVGGAGVARGYLGVADVTAAKFVPDPFSGEPGARLYRTGDLARHRADGNLEFIGRVDQQVKVRGFRIELQEIEAVLGEHPAVEETAVIVREDQPGDKRLVAYAVLRAGAAAMVGELLDHLGVRLPKYMIPHTVVLLDRLPLTVNGKIDRDLLPQPSALRATPEAEPQRAPASGIEETLKAIWCDVLALEYVERDEDFFALGGHSLLAIQLMARVREALGVELPLTAVFEYPTVRLFADHAETFLWATKGRPQPATNTAREAIEL